MAATVISIANQKGGVAKTTTTSALAYELKSRGYNVLVIDADGQCNTSDAFQAQIEGHVTLVDLMDDIRDNTKNRHLDPIKAIQKTEYIDIIAGDYLLKQADSRYTLLGRETYLKKAIEPVKKIYDFIIIDTIPGLGVMLTASLTASDYVIIPMEPNRDSLQGIEQLNLVVESVQDYSNPNLKILGMLLVKVKENTELFKNFKNDISYVAEILQTKTYNAMIRDNIHVQNARANFMPVAEYRDRNKDKKVRAADDYKDFVTEMLNDLENQK